MSGDYISRAAAINKIMENIVHQDSHDINLHNIGLRKAMSAIDSLPAADVVEVVHARPVKFYCNARTGRMITTCSACDLQIGPYDSFCKHCGAKMDGGQDA